jgi:hypothetical protein
LGRNFNSRLTLHQRPALTQVRIFAETRAVRALEKIIKEKCALMAELKESGEEHAIAAAEQELSKLRNGLYMAQRRLAQARYGLAPRSTPAEP